MDWLDEQDGSISENVRAALEEYIDDGE